ncbi:nuclease, partial [Enterobacter hormaechei]
PPGQREKLMASFERVLMPGLDKDQYSVLWVEHTDKGRLELNFLIPNTELLTGKRLQPYFDRADRPRIDAWQTVVNGRLGLHDPNAPENRRALVTASALPETKQEAAQAITQGLLALASSGELKTRQDVTAALESAGFEVVRTTRSSISIADPDGGRNIRLKGAIYEQSFNAGEGLGAEIESAAAAYRRDAESRIQRARAVCQSGTECKREENQRRHPRPRGEYELGHGKEPAERAAHGRADMAHRPDDGRPACRDERERAVVAGPADNRQLHGHSPAGGYAEETHRPDVGRALSGEQRRPEIPYPAAGDAIRSYPLRRDDLDPPETGVAENDRTGKAVAERIRAATAGLLAKAGRVGERLRGMAEDVWAYATGERDAERARVGLERARVGLERAGAEFERAAAPLVRELNTAERRQREHEYQKSLEQQRQPQKTYKGPTLG